LCEITIVEMKPPASSLIWRKTADVKRYEILEVIAVDVVLLSEEAFRVDLWLLKIGEQILCWPRVTLKLRRSCPAVLESAKKRGLAKRLYLQ
jgi:hypothetical protein